MTNAGDMDKETELPVAHHEDAPGSADEAVRRALASKMKAAAFGEIVSLLMRSPQHRRLTLADLEALVLPAVVARQYMVAKTKRQDDPSSTGMPVGAIFWACVSDELDRRLTAELDQPVPIAAADWTGGPNLWVMEVVASPQVAGAMLDELRRTAFSGREAKIRVKKDGKLMVERLKGAPAAA